MPNLLKNKSFSAIRNIGRSAHGKSVSITPDEATILTIVSPHSKLPTSVRLRMLEGKNLKGKARDAAGVLAKRSTPKRVVGDSITVKGILDWNDQFSHPKLNRYSGELETIQFAPVNDFLSK